MDHLFVVASGIAIGTTLIAAITGEFSKIFTWAMRLMGTIFFTKKIISDVGTLDILVHHLKKRAVRIGGTGEDFIDARNTYIRAESDYRQVFFRMVSATFQVFLLRGRPIFFLPNVDENGKHQQSPTGTLYAFRGIVNWEKMFKHASDDWRELAELQKGRIRRFQIIKLVGTRGQDSAKDGSPKAPPIGGRYISPGESVNTIAIGYHADELGLQWHDDPLGELALTPETKKIIQDVKFWHRNREWYQERDISWRRGYLIFGKPGTGKTSLIRALAQDLDMTVFTFDLASMSNQDFLLAWAQTNQIAEKIILLEDFDSVFHLRENISGSELTYDTILNAIDGIERQDGTLLFVTTNKLELVDPAMGIPDKNGRSTRPGRCDVAIELPSLDHAGRVKIALHITKDPVASEALAIEGAEDTAAQFKYRAEEWARNELWSVAA